MMWTKFEIFNNCVILATVFSFNYIRYFLVELIGNENEYLETIIFIFYLLGGVAFASVIAKLIEFLLRKEPEADEKTEKRVKSWKNDICLIIYLFIGQAICQSFWQAIITSPEIRERTATEKDCYYPNQNFVELVIHMLLFCFFGSYILFCKRNVPSGYLYKWLFCSFSSDFNLWCYNLALKNISYVTQISSSAMRLLPVMALSKLLLRKKYQYFEYGTAIFISIGMAIILYSMIYFAPITEEFRRTNELGIVLLFLSQIFGSFSVVWTYNLLTKHEMTYAHALCGGNLFRAVYSVISTFKSDYQKPLECIIMYPDLAVYYILNTVNALQKQLTDLIIIYWAEPDLYMIKNIVFQAEAVVSSSLNGYHQLPPYATSGIVILIGAVILRLYFERKLRKDFKTKIV